MCGRYTIVLDKKEFKFPEEYAVQQLELPSIYNAAPTMQLPVMVEGGYIKFFRWGIIPQDFRGEVKSLGGKYANGRGETINTTYPFKNSFSKQHCLILVDSFFEWDETTKPKQPYRFLMKDENPFFLAGIWSEWTDRKTGAIIPSFSLITIESNEVVGAIHHRMPVIIKPDYAAQWLDTKNTNVDTYLGMLKPYSADDMKAYPVSIGLNNARNNFPELLIPVEPQKSLF